jgi:hypothetical protein
MGTISAASAAINIDNPRVKGIVLTASVTRDAPGNLSSQSLGKIKLPVLMIHHETDQCFACVPSGAKELIHDFKSSSKKEFLMVGGGGPLRETHAKTSIGMDLLVLKIRLLKIFLIGLRKIISRFGILDPVSIPPRATKNSH